MQKNLIQKKLYIILSFILFLPGFLYFIFYNDIFIFLYEKLIHMDKYLFWTAYFISLYLLYKNAQFFIKIIDKYLIIKSDQSLKDKFLTVLNIVYISCYLGFIVNIATIFSFATFAFL